MPEDILKIFDVSIKKLSEQDLLKIVQNFISLNQKGTVSYVNANSLNLVYKDDKMKKYLSGFNILHPDGLGIFLASKFLYGKDGFAARMTGSDFYIELIKESLKNKWSFFFFGDTNETLSKISNTNPGLNVKGWCNGFNFNENELINNINTAKPDILIVGLGSPKQEEWIIGNKDKINSKVIIAVGDGIKVFSGTKKRGNKLVRRLGLEWVVRLINEPKRLWKRYLIGIPLFIFRVIRFKLTSNKFG